MSTSMEAAERQGRNAFHALAALGSAKQAGKTVSSTPKKTVTASLMAKDKSGRTPLHFAAYYGHIRVLKAFLEACPEAGDVRDSDGNTPRDALRRPLAAVAGDPELHKNFQRLVRVDRNGFEHQDFGTGAPMDVWDVAMSSKTSVVVVEPAWQNARNDARSVFCLMHNELKQLDLGDSLPRFVATSNVHSLVVTSDRCFAWGKNKNGILGLDTDEKVVVEPRMIDFYFGNASGNDYTNTFSALNHGFGSAVIKDPLIGVACCDFYSACYTTTKVWCWGTNRGQMVNRAPHGAEILDPELIFESENRIRSVACCDSALIVLTTNGQVHALSGGRCNRIVLGKSQPTVESIAGKGDYLVVHTSQGKLLRTKIAANTEDSVATVWTPRRTKDEISSFDLGENGTVIIATKASVFKVEDGRDILELKNLKGMPIATIRTDSLCKASVAVCNVNASLNHSGDELPRLSHWPTPDFKLFVDKAEVSVHKAVLFARCPTLAGLIDSSSDKLVAAPGGSSVLAFDGHIVVRHAPLDSVQAFVRSLYHETIDETMLTSLSATSLHEFHALHRLATRSLGLGLLEARHADIGCDMILRSGARVHSVVLKSMSPVLAAQWNRWTDGELDCPALSSDSEIEAAILDYMYTHRLPESDAPLISQARRLFELWQVSDELLMPSLSHRCERDLFTMLDLEMVIPFMQETVWSQHLVSTKLYASLLNVIIRHLSFFMPLLVNLDAKTLESVETHFMATEGTEPADPVLAGAYDALVKTPSTSGKKKGRTVSIPANRSPSTTSQSPTRTSPSPAPASSPGPSPSPVPAATNASPMPSKLPASKPLKPLGEDLTSGWIQAKKKTRASFSADDRSQVNAALPPQMSSSTARNSTLRPPTAPPPASLANLPKLGGSKDHKHMEAAARSNGSGSNPGERPSIAQNLPKLGESLPGNLPKLGSKPRSKSSSKSKPKFNSKTTLQFDSPFTMAQELQKQEEPVTPWKQVPKVVRTAPSVLENLERNHQINSRRMAGQSVWGFRG